MKWTDEAKLLAKEIPLFVRPFAKKKIETLAAEMGANLITKEIYINAKSKFDKPK